MIYTELINQFRFCDAGSFSISYHMSVWYTLTFQNYTHFKKLTGKTKEKFDLNDFCKFLYTILDNPAFFGESDIKNNVNDDNDEYFIDFSTVSLTQWNKIRKDYLIWVEEFKRTHPLNTKIPDDKPNDFTFTG